MPSTSVTTIKNGERKSDTLSIDPSGRQTRSTSGSTEKLRTETTTRTWVRTPSFHKLAKLKKLPSQPFSFSRVTSTCTVGSDNKTSTSWSNYTNSITTWGVISPFMLPNCGEDASPISSADEAQTDARVINDLLLSIKDQKVNLLQAFAERQQTVNLLADSAMRIAESLRQIRKGNVVAAGLALGQKFSRKTRRVIRKHITGDDVGSAWLAAQYGWKPLLADCYGAAELLAQRDVFEVRTRTSKHRSRHGSSQRPLSSGYYKGTHHTVEDITIKYTCRFSSSGTILPTLTQVGLTNPLLIAWELMPWSFVVDWFIPIGNYISSLDATLGVHFVDGCKTIVRERKSTDVWDTSIYNLGGAVRFSKGTINATGTFDRVTVSRVKLSGFPSPRLPAFKNPLSFTHLANAIALLSVNARR